MFCVDENKLEEFTVSQFSLENLQLPPFRRDWNTNRGGKLVYLKQGIIAKRLENLETKFSETICIELTISKGKRCALLHIGSQNKIRLYFLKRYQTA